VAGVRAAVGLNHARGAQAPTEPTELRIADIGVVARVERVSIVGGVMQSPSNLAVAGWYNQTSRLGENGNAVLTGYYQWSGMPALLADLAMLKGGEEIRLLGADAREYRYRVSWVATYEKASAPLQEIVGPTARDAVTLITDAGEYDYTKGVFLRSTVVRAVLP
jgi:hypothetical protein